MSDRHFTFHVNHYGYKHVYDVETLENYLQWSTRDITNMKEQIQKTEEYQEFVKNQIRLVSSIETVPEVNLQRTVYKSVEFFVSVRHVPQIEVEEGKRQPYIKSTDNKKFEGKERHIALEYAQELADKYNCDIKKVGFKK